VRSIQFHPRAWEDFNHWINADPKLLDRLCRLIAEAARDPFGGIGKPEPLRHELAGYWSRRINDEHRLVYRATPEALLIASCRHHY
jgi:toxin YoeB